MPVNAGATVKGPRYGFARCLASILLALLAQGCMKVTIQGYEELTLELDGLSELNISTYPSWFPSQTTSVPFLYKELRTPDSVYFQLFVRAKGKKSGPNPHIDSIVIHSFSYEFPGQAHVPLISDFDDHYWRQGNPRDQDEDPEPVPLSQGWHLVLKVDMTLNGTRYRFEERSDATSRHIVRPLLLAVLD